MKTILSGAAVCVFAATASLAQSPPRIPADPVGMPQRQEGAVRVQSSINVFLPGSTNESEEAQKLRDRGKRLIYEIAARECDLLREVLAKDCRLESINNNIGRQSYGNQPEGYTVNGQMSFVITLK
jgi:hypothetical protein